MTRKVHLRPTAAIHQGKTTTACGKPIWVLAETDTSAAVSSFAHLDATIHGTLVTCERCLDGTKRAASL